MLQVRWNDFSSKLDMTFVNLGPVVSFPSGTCAIFEAVICTERFLKKMVSKHGNKISDPLAAAVVYTPWVSRFEALWTVASHLWGVLTWTNFHVSKDGDAFSVRIVTKITKNQILFIELMNWCILENVPTQTIWLPHVPQRVAKNHVSQIIFRILMHLRYFLALLFLNCQKCIRARTFAIFSVQNSTWPTASKISPSLWERAQFPRNISARLASLADLVYIIWINWSWLPTCIRKR